MTLYLQVVPTHSQIHHVEVEYIKKTEGSNVRSSLEWQRVVPLGELTTVVLALHQAFPLYLLIAMTNIR